MNDHLKQRYIDAAKDMFHDEGTIEIDEEPEISADNGGDVDGVYVAAWVWVGKEDI